MTDNKPKEIGSIDLEVVRNKGEIASVKSELQSMKTITESHNLRINKLELRVDALRLDFQNLEKQFARFTTEIQNNIKQIPNMNEERWNSIMALPSKKDIYLSVGLPLLLFAAGILIVMFGDRLHWWSPDPTQAPPVSTLNQTSQGSLNSGEPYYYTGSKTHSHSPEGISLKRDDKSQAHPASR